MSRTGETRGDTCHIDVIDRWGNIVSATPSGGWLQSSPTIPELGFCLGTRLQMTWLEEGSASTLTPGKRPRTTLTPTLVLRDGVPVTALGSPGGDQQDQWQLLYLLRTIVGGYAPQQAIDAPALHTTSHRRSRSGRAPGCPRARWSRPGSATRSSRASRRAATASRAPATGRSAGCRRSDAIRETRHPERGGQPARDAGLRRRALTARPPTSRRVPTAAAHDRDRALDVLAASGEPVAHREAQHRLAAPRRRRRERGPVAPAAPPDRPRALVACRTRRRPACRPRR